KRSLSPVEEILIAKRDGKLSSRDAEVQIDALANRPHIYEDYLKYIYQTPVIQRHSLSVNGGGDIHTYYISGGYDHGLGNKINTDNSRMTLHVKNTFNPFKGLQLNAN